MQKKIRVKNGVKSKVRTSESFLYEKYSSKLNSEPSETSKFYPSNVAQRSAECALEARQINFTISKATNKSNKPYELSPLVYHKPRHTCNISAAVQRVQRGHHAHPLSPPTQSTSTSATLQPPSTNQHIDLTGLDSDDSSLLHLRDHGISKT